ncbi:MAG: peptidoglycan DD-metalloendopeptidase family protein [Candidatus Shapirobacteria bacterium]|jgi:peptidoglycan hydrolase CwlO-like protein
MSGLFKPSYPTYRVLCLSLICLVFYLLSGNPLFSQDNISDLQSRINEYSDKLDQLSKAKDTLANQIRLLNSQVDLTLLKITQAENQIKILQNDISILTVKIDTLDIKLNQTSSQYIEQVIQNYKLPKKTSPLALFANSKFDDFFKKYKYYSLIQKSSHDSLLNMEYVRTNYDIQKKEKTKKQQELEIIEKKLAEQKLNLAKQKDNKTNLLAVTKNDETKYQQLKRAAEDELNSLLKAQFVGSRQVKKGDALGTMGNTGYSFGDHLHFGLYDLSADKITSWTYQNDIDPFSYLQSNRWPMESLKLPDNVYSNCQSEGSITQCRGHTRYSYLYADKFHHGIDMVSSQKTIYAVNDGVAYFFRNPSSSLGNHVKLFHADGKMSLYLHLQ